VLPLRRATPAHSHRLLVASAREAHRRTSMATTTTTILGKGRAPEWEEASRTGIRLWIMIKLGLILS
jgi:hypothetical protein